MHRAAFPGNRSPAGQLRARRRYLRGPTPDAPALSAAAAPGGARTEPRGPRSPHRVPNPAPTTPALRPSVAERPAPRGGGRSPRRPAPAVTEQPRAEPRRGRAPGLGPPRRHGRPGAAAAPLAVTMATAPPALPPGKPARPRERRTNGSAESRAMTNQRLSEAGLSGAAGGVADGAAEGTKMSKSVVSVWGCHAVSLTSHEVPKCLHNGPRGGGGGVSACPPVSQHPVVSHDIPLGVMQHLLGSQSVPKCPTTSYTVCSHPIVPTGVPQRLLVSTGSLSVPRDPTVSPGPCTVTWRRF